MKSSTLEIVLATRNEGKVREIRNLLADISVTLRTVASIPDMPEVDETEGSLQGNAIKKARTIFKHTGLPSLADDTGLEVDALHGQPGVHSARFAGENASDDENRAYLLQELRNVDDRTARFCTVVAFIDKSGLYIFEGACEGKILKEEIGNAGFGYDSLFQPHGSSRSFAQMSQEEKNQISHRGKALIKCIAFLREITELS